MKTYQVSTPSRLCLFGEHQDYLGLEVIACAINLRFSAKIKDNGTDVINIKIRDSHIDTLGMENTEGAYEETSISLAEPITYENNRDYLKSSVNVLKRGGYPLRGFDIVMDSEIPIGKGMCSSSTMIVALIKALLTAMEHPDGENPEKIAYLGYLAEVEEFGEPGGMMDHYASALGGLVNLDFTGGKTTPHRLDTVIPGVFILFDSKEQKNTTKVLADAKTPTLEGLGATGATIKGLAAGRETMDLLSDLDEKHKKAVLANVSNYKILTEAKAMLQNKVDPKRLGKLLYAHHENLRDGLGVSTPKIDAIIEAAMVAGALGGKVNGSGGGGCGYVYAEADKADAVVAAISALGYPAKIIYQDTGVRCDGVIE